MKERSFLGCLLLWNLFSATSSKVEPYSFLTGGSLWGDGAAELVTDEGYDSIGFVTETFNELQNGFDWVMLDVLHSSFREGFFGKNCLEKFDKLVGLICYCRVTETAFLFS